MRFEDWLEEDEPMFEMWAPNVRVVKRENGTVTLYNTLTDDYWDEADD